MNERIRELADQSTEHYPATETSGEFSTFDKEKFALEIIRQCLILAHFEGKDRSAAGIRDRIKTHFGVE